jgi:hypothetical protein
MHACGQTCSTTIIIINYVSHCSIDRLSDVSAEEAMVLLLATLDGGGGGGGAGGGGSGHALLAE